MNYNQDDIIEELLRDAKDNSAWFVKGLIIGFCLGSIFWYLISVL